MKYYHRTSLVLLSLMLLVACKPNESVTNKENPNENLVTATLYQYYAAEYKALAIQAYNIATRELNKVYSQNIDVSKKAIILDIDETVLDNSPYQAKLIQTGQSYPAYWNEWCRNEAARPVPGSLEFLNHADSLGCQIFYVSNRKKKYLEEATLNNLQKAGFPQALKDHLFLREEKSENNPYPSDKQARRNKIKEMGFDIVLLVGDNLGDFYIDGKNNETERRNIAENYEIFGSKFILLPNAMYGNWTGRSGVRDAFSVDSLIEVMNEAWEQE